MAMVICGCAVIGIMAILGGYMGSHHHIGFTVVSRRSVVPEQKMTDVMLMAVKLMGNAWSSLASVEQSDDRMCLDGYDWFISS